MELSHITFRGPDLDDHEVLMEVPANLRNLLLSINGFIQFGGGLHVRGACLEPEWHSLRSAWRGPKAFHELYTAVEDAWVPFAEDCVGDQFLLDNSDVCRLLAETGEVERMGVTLGEFFERVSADPIEFLSMHPLLQFQQENGDIAIGHLIHAYPPFCTEEAAQGVSLKAVPALELRSAHSELANLLADDGARVRIKISD